VCSSDLLAATLPLVRPGGWLSVQGGPSAVPPGATDVAAVVAALLRPHVVDLARLDVVLPSYGEGNAFFHGRVPGRRGAA
jgi:hypothetical protein